MDEKEWEKFVGEPECDPADYMPDMTKAEDENNSLLRSRSEDEE